MTDKELKERLKSVPKTERACSYTIWPYSPEEYKGKRFGALPDSFLRWILSIMSSSKEERNQLLAQRAREEIRLRSNFVRNAVGSNASRGYVTFRRAAVKPIYTEDIFVDPAEPIVAPDLPVMAWSEDPFEWEDKKPKKKSPKKVEPEAPPKPKKHGIEL